MDNEHDDRYEREVLREDALFHRMDELNIEWITTIRHAPQLGHAEEWAWEISDADGQHIAGDWCLTEAGARVRAAQERSTMLRRHAELEAERDTHDL